MVFSQLQFIFYFLPAVLLVYFLTPRGARNVILVVASIVFYMWGAVMFVPVLLASIVINYAFGLLIDAAQNRSALFAARAALTGGVVFNLGLLGYFKYANFFVSQLDLVLKDASVASPPWTTVLLPIGISFYTFHSMSYMIDIYRQTSRAFRNPIDFSVYVAFFPQLIAGPIVRFHQIAEAIRSRSIDLQDLGEGSIRFSYGLFKKVLIADPIGEIAAPIFSTQADHLSMSVAWLGAIAYTFQLYFDFSGYCDMAIGLARMFGFHLPENFVRPYSALSITDFWRRWHMTLSAWFRDYLFIPMGGSRTSHARTYFNLIVVFVLVGLWHGANWTFIVWGAYHGALLIVERVGGQRVFEWSRFGPARQAVTFVLVVIGWVMFRADSVGYAIQYYHALVTPVNVALPTAVDAALSHRNVAALTLAAATVFLPRNLAIGRWLVESQNPFVAVARVTLLIVVFPASLTAVVSTDFRPFLYFQF
jgi:alginate O-acetyltransferase complex protein AlgI